MYMDLLAGKKGIDEKEAGSNEDGKSFFWVEHSEAKVEKRKTDLWFFDNCQISCEFYHTFAAIEIKISLYGVIIKLTEWQVKPKI